MTVKKKMMMTSSMVLSLLTSNLAQAQELVWTPRSVDDIATDFNGQSDQSSYTIKYGDTLSTIAQALSVDLSVLAQINEISDVDVIYANAVLTTRVNHQDGVLEVDIQAPVTKDETVKVSAVVDLSTNQVTEVIQSGMTDPTPPPLTEVPLQPSVQPEEALPTELVAAEDTSNEVPPTPAVPVIEASAEELPVAEVTLAEAEEGAPATSVTEAQLPAADPATSETPPSMSEVQPEPIPVVETPAPQPEVVTTTPSPALTTVTTFTGSTAGLQPHVVAYKEEVLSVFGNMWVHGYRADSGDHGKGLALDFMVPVSSVLGDQIAAYAAADMGNKKISYIIWKQRFYAPFDSIYGPAYTWNLMPDRGSVTENHYDHVHVSFNP